MTPELTVLTLAALLQVGQYCAYSIAGNLQVGATKALGPRDESIHLTGRAGRIQRALNNHFEGLILFTIACVVISLSGQSTTFTAACAWVFLIARVVYIPAYVFGLSPWRSFIWMVGFGATFLMLIAGLV